MLTRVRVCVRVCVHVCFRMFGLRWARLFLWVDFDFNALQTAGSGGGSSGEEGRGRKQTGTFLTVQSRIQQFFPWDNEGHNSNIRNVFSIEWERGVTGMESHFNKINETEPIKEWVQQKERRMVKSKLMNHFLWENLTTSLDETPATGGHTRSHERMKRCHTTKNRISCGIAGDPSSPSQPFSCVVPSHY